MISFIYHDLEDCWEAKLIHVASPSLEERRILQSVLFIDRSGESQKKGVSSFIYCVMESKFTFRHDPRDRSLLQKEY